MRQALVFLLALSWPAAAQVPVSPGTRVRLIPESRHEPPRAGKVVSISDDSVTVRFEPVPEWELRAETQQVARSRLEAVVATRRFKARGAVIGAVTGIVAGAIASRPYRPYCEPIGRLGGQSCWSDNTPTVVFGIAGGLAGAGMGALAGAMIRKDTWSPLITR